MTDSNLGKPKIHIGSRLAVLGFIFMLAGPILLSAAQFVFNVFGIVFNTVFANIYVGICAVLPCAGFITGIVSLCFWKRTKILSRALGIVTVIMANPFFLMFYIFICALSGMTLANLPLM